MNKITIKSLAALALSVALTARAVRAVITGTSACSINSMQVDYGR